MDRFVVYIKVKQTHELVINKPLELRNVSYFDSSYRDCKDTRETNMGEVHTIGGAIKS